jgi:hypothetical protein
MKRLSKTARRRPGRPRKFGRPSRVIAVTLPEDAIDRLRRVHRDLAWAILKLLDKGQAATLATDAQPDVELVTIAERRSLIVVNRDAVGNLPGVSIVPLYGNRAFLALDIDRGMSDLELSVVDRLAQPRINGREREAIADLRAKLTAWRHDPAVQVETRAIIVIEEPVAARVTKARRKTSSRSRAHPFRSGPT